jgi:hypothetical protein
MQDPIEITPKDIIKRPLETAIGATTNELKKGNFLQQMVDGLKQAKEIKKQLDDLGIDINTFFNLGGNNSGGGLGPPPPGGGGPVGGDARAPHAAPAPTPAPNPMQTAKGLLTLLRMKYGDITIGELMAQLKSEYGEKRISEFLSQ